MSPGALISPTEGLSSPIRELDYYNSHKLALSLRRDLFLTGGGERPMPGVHPPAPSEGEERERYPEREIP